MALHDSPSPRALHRYSLPSAPDGITYRTDQRAGKTIELQDPVDLGSICEGHGGIQVAWFLRSPVARLVFDLHV